MPFGLMGRLGQMNDVLDGSPHLTRKKGMKRRNVTYKENVASVVKKQLNRLICRFEMVSEAQGIVN